MGALPVDLHGGLIEFPEEHLAEVDGLDPIVGFLESDVLSAQRTAKNEQVVLEANGPDTRDVFDQQVARILQRRERIGIGTRRGLVVRGGRITRERFMRSLFVVFAAKLIEAALLLREIGLGRARGLVFQRPMHSFVRCVLLWGRGTDPLMLNAETQPPDVESREPMQPGAGERHAVVGANRQR